MPSETTPPRVAVGEVLAGKYRVERVIGEGGMGVVVAAKHLQLDTLVALKFITQDRGHAVARFLQEARSAVRLKSEHVARVSDVGTLENGMPYMVMEYLEGQDLNSLVEASGPLPVVDAVGYVVHALEAVAEAHAIGIVHRDLKPHNLFLTAGVGGRPKVKVLDFGISKTIGAELALTRSAEIVGTPTYMAPEQLRSAKDVDHRADIWALGVILYELLTARLPFEAESLPQLCTMVLSETPLPPVAHRPDLPQPLSDAIVRCLQRAPADRYADVSELANALAPFAPEWASARAVLEVGRSSSGSGPRVVVGSSVPGMAASNAAWSETQLVPKARTRWKTPAMAITAALAIGGVVASAFHMGASSAAASAAAASGPAAASPLPAASAAAAPEPPASSAARTAASTVAVAEAVPQPTTSAVSTPAANAPPKGRDRGANKPRLHTDPTAAPAPEPTDDPFNSRR